MMVLLRRYLTVNILELKNILNREHVPAKYISFNKSDKMVSEVTLCLRKQADGRLLYYVQERANREDEKYFNNEHDACLHILKNLKYDYPSTQKYL